MKHRSGFGAWHFKSPTINAMQWREDKPDPAFLSMTGGATEYIRADLSPLAAVVMQDAVAAEARRYAEMYGSGTDGRNTFVIFADWADRLPLPYAPALLAAAKQLPEVAALIAWLAMKTRDIETGETMYDDARPDIYVGEILERLAAIGGAQ